MLGEHHIALRRQLQAKPVLVIMGDIRGVAMAEMGKDFKVDLTLTILHLQPLGQHVDADFLIHFTTRGRQR